MDAEAARDQRSVGALSIVLSDRDGRPRLARSFQSGSARLRFPRTAAGVEAMVLNTSGGLAAGDRFSLEAAVEAHRLTLSTQACERVYRCEGARPAEVEQHFTVAGGAALRALPQPTIVFDGARLLRRTKAVLAEGARLTLVESLVFGREAMGERVRCAHVREILDVSIGGTLAFADRLTLDAAAFCDPSAPAGLAGARGAGLVVHVGAAPVGGADAADTIREAGGGEGVRVGASALNGVTVGRCLASSHGALHSALARIVQALDGEAAPRTWAL